MAKNVEMEIESIIGGMKCPRDFVCYKSGLDDLCKAEDVGLKAYLMCLDKDANECKFSLRWKMGRLCQCPLRMYLSRNVEQ
ncbi:MAG: hypothetical protein V3R87_07875 [Dehalococcoidia bacterium]